jgi:hypothetical protein
MRNLELVLTVARLNDHRKVNGLRMPRAGEGKLAKPWVERM